MFKPNRLLSNKNKRFKTKHNKNVHEVSSLLVYCNSLLNTVYLAFLDSKFLWSDLTYLGDYTNWKAGEGEESQGNCVTASTETGEWVTVPCSSVAGYVCKVPKSTSLCLSHTDTVYNSFSTSWNLDVISIQVFQTVEDGFKKWIKKKICKYAQFWSENMNILWFFFMFKNFF